MTFHHSRALSCNGVPSWPSQSSCSLPSPLPTTLMGVFMLVLELATREVAFISLFVALF